MFHAYQSDCHVAVLTCSCCFAYLCASKIKRVWQTNKHRHQMWKRISALSESVFLGEWNGSDVSVWDKYIREYIYKRMIYKRNIYNRTTYERNI
jgi:hypothetical protein